MIRLTDRKFRNELETSSGRLAHTQQRSDWPILIVHRRCSRNVHFMVCCSVLGVPLLWMRSQELKRIEVNMITGGCLCGAIRYQAHGSSLFAMLCHCRDCQRSSGTGHVPVLGMPRAQFKVAGATKIYALPGTTGLSAIRHFCPTCGSLLFGMPEAAPDAVTIYVGSLDDPSIFQPDTVLFTRSRHPWDRTMGSFQEFDALPTAPAATK